MQGSLGHLLQYLSSGQIPHVPGIGVSHQQLWLVTTQVLDPVHVSLCGLGALDSVLPIFTKEVSNIFLQSFCPVQLLREIQRSDGRFLLVPVQFLLQRRICVVQGGCGKLYTRDSGVNGLQGIHSSFTNYKVLKCRPL